MPEQDEIRVLAPTGITGSGFLKSSFEQGLAQKSHFIVERDAVYKYNINHVVETDSPTEMFPMSPYDVSGSTVKALQP